MTIDMIKAVPPVPRENQMTGYFLRKSCIFTKRYIKGDMNRLITLFLCHVNQVFSNSPAKPIKKKNTTKRINTGDRMAGDKEILTKQQRLYLKGLTFL